MTRSHWHATLDQAPLPGHELPPHAEVVVVGGGILGAMITYWLTRAGVAPLLLEQGGPAAGASGNNGGLCITGTPEPYPIAVQRLGRARAQEVWALTLRGLAMLRSVVEEEGIACDLRPDGHLELAANPAQLAALTQAAVELQADGFQSSIVDRTAITPLLGLPPGDELLGARYNEAAARLHSARLVHGLFAVTARRGARFCWKTPVTSLDISASPRQVTLTTPRGVVTASAAVVALNAWSSDLLPELAGIVRPVRGQALATAPVAPSLNLAFGVDLTPTGEYGQQTVDGTIVFGGCRALAPQRDVDIREPVPTPLVQDALDTALGRIFPSLAGVPVVRRWAGLMGFTPDYLPVAGSVERLPGVWFAGGFCGHGMPFAGPFGRLLAEAALAGTLPPELEPYRLQRPTLAQTPE